MFYNLPESLKSELKAFYYQTVKPSTEGNDLQVRLTKKANLGLFNKVLDELENLGIDRKTNPGQWSLPFHELIIDGSGRGTVWYEPERKTRFLPDALGGYTFKLWSMTNTEWFLTKNVYNEDAAKLLDEIINEFKSLTLTQYAILSSKLKEIVKIMQERAKLFENDSYLKEHFESLEERAYNHTHTLLDLLKNK